MSSQMGRQGGGRGSRPGRQWPDGEDAELVEDAVVGELDLEADALDAAAVEQRHGVVALAVLRPRRADDDARPPIGGVGGQRLHRLAAGILERRLQHEVSGG